MKKTCRPIPGRCPKCSNFMNWAHAWDNLWRCLQCGETVAVGEPTSSYRAVEEAMDRARAGLPWNSREIIER